MRNQPLIDLLSEGKHFFIIRNLIYITQDSTPYKEKGDK